jgi:hypothetical protein
VRREFSYQPLNHLPSYALPPVFRVNGELGYIYCSLRKEG